MAKQRGPAPTPVVVTTICSMCGLGWEEHGPDPTTEDCIRLLRAELARRPAVINIGRSYPVPYPAPYPVRPYGPIWYGPPTITCNTAGSATPRVIEGSCLPVTG